MLRTNIAAMQQDIRLQYEQTVEDTHHGRPVLVQTVHTGRPGRPSYHIDREFLQWAYTMRSTASISRFLGVGRSVVRDSLLAYGIASEQEIPLSLADANPSDDSGASDDNDSDTSSISSDTQEAGRDDLLDPQSDVSDAALSDSANPPPNHTGHTPHISSYTRPLSDISDADLDLIILRLRSHFHRAGISMMDGMLRRLGYHLPRERVRQSLLRIDPVHRVFERITIRRRTYSVPGPNVLWHHDGQHGESLLH